MGYFFLNHTLFTNGNGNEKWKTPSSEDNGEQKIQRNNTELLIQISQIFAQLFFFFLLFDQCNTLLRKSSKKEKKKKTERIGVELTKNNNAVFTATSSLFANLLLHKNRIKNSTSWNYFAAAKSNGRKFTLLVGEIK